MGNTTYVNGFGRASASPPLQEPTKATWSVGFKNRTKLRTCSLCRSIGRSLQRLSPYVVQHPRGAEDIAQEVFMRAFMSIGTFREELSSPLGYRIAMNLCRNRIKYHQRRAANRHMSVENLLKANISAVVVGLRVKRHQHQEVSRGFASPNPYSTALLQLDDDFRRLLVLRDLEGLSYLDIMKLLVYLRGL